MRGPVAILVPFLIVLLLGATTAPAPSESTPQGLPTINVSVKKVGEVWKVVQTGTTNVSVRARKGQKIVFMAEGTDVYFQFDNDGLFGGHTKYLKSGNKMTLTVGNVAKGTYIYAAFCMGPKQFAEGGSPPKIIVD